MPSLPSTAPGNRLLTPRKPGHETRHRTFVEDLRLAELLVATLVHDGDAIRHRHRLFLVVGHVDEGDPDLLLDALELDLHLLAQLEVERTERLVEEQHRGLVDQGARQGDALRLATRDLGRLGDVSKPASSTRASMSVTRLLTSASLMPLRRSPKATFS